MSTIFTEEYLRENCIRLRDVKLGADVKIYSFVNAYGCEIGDESRVGAFVEIQKNVIIGRRCKISSHSFICEGVTIEDNVFVGHGVMFTNDKYPRATNPDGSSQSDADWQVVPTLVSAEQASARTQPSLPALPLARMPWSAPEPS